MRARPLALFLGTGCFCIIALALRHHIFQVAEVARTYATFHRLVEKHPELLYRYPEPAEGPERVPKRIHHIALGGGTQVSEHDEAIRSCREPHPTWEHHVWTDDKAVEFLQEHYPDILPHYTGYAQNIQRANVLRYALLHKLGGVYLDLDVSCHVALDSTPIVRLPLVTPGAYPAGVNNAFIAAQPRHPFLARVLDQVPHHDMFWGVPMRIPYVENMMSTGCMFFTNRWMSHVRDLLAGRQDQPVYVLADAEGRMEPHMLRGRVTTPLFTHGGASSWHGWDAALILVIGKHYLVFGALLCATVVGTGLAAVHLCKASRRRSWFRRRSWTAGLAKGA
ncbi:glycosyltransferase family 32 [Emericellopsis cladophorae]|uniref:Glycosyltransferase family 32 n=1 Tax=Emericellopsis cladophorae TaxID=2686198 RepID=A0A9P9Y458_9HYPO|nr:glycosyltransferase family 32 [Emericellopsis cladophorae]KAI6782775.1 glycosyltransferase family 32 [Emericellopsis cladophorae]